MHNVQPLDGIETLQTGISMQSGTLS